MINPIENTKAWKQMVKQAMREADDALYADHAAGIFGEGDPNHPKYNNGINYVTGLPATIFGYDTKALLYGNNSFMHDKMVADRETLSYLPFTSVEVSDYAYVK